MAVRGQEVVNSPIYRWLTGRQRDRPADKLNKTADHLECLVPVLQPIRRKMTQLRFYAARYNQLRVFVLMDVAWCVASPAESEIKSGLRAPRHQELRDPPLPSPLRDPWSRVA
ncbi:hypothetical protein CBL_20504 [Carabus blaptoides fortunei]